MKLSKREEEIAAILKETRPQTTVREGMSNAALQRALIADKAARDAWWDVVGAMQQLVHEDRCNTFLSAVR